MSKEKDYAVTKEGVLWTICSENYLYYYGICPNRFGAIPKSEVAYTLTVKKCTSSFWIPENDLQQIEMKKAMGGHYEIPNITYHESQYLRDNMVAGMIADCEKLFKASE